MKILLSTASVVALLATTPAFAATTPTNNATPANAASSPAAAQSPANQTPPTQPTGTTPHTAQPNETATTATSQAPNSPDANFVQQAADGGRAEVAMGNLAQLRGATSAVREFGRWMSTDHTMLNDMLADRAQQAEICNSLRDRMRRTGRRCTISKDCMGRLSTVPISQPNLRRIGRPCSFYRTKRNPDKMRG